MYYCPNCKKKFRHYRRNCPICGKRCLHPRLSTTLKLFIAIGILSIVLVGLVIVMCLMMRSDSPGDTTSPSVSTGASTIPSSQASQPSSVPTDPPTTPSAPPTEPSVPPTEPSVPSTAPSVPSTEPVGTGMYTREELEALDNTQFGYGPGPLRDYLNYRPEYAVGEQSRYQQYGANFIAPDNGKIYLTFDCGYEHYTTDKAGNSIPVTGIILDTLKEKNAKGVFFITMDYAESNPELVRRMIDEGHAVGNHTNQHPVMPTLSIDDMVYEVMSLHNYVQEHFGYTMKLFRPPEGAFSVRSLAVVQNLGYKTVHWSFAHADYAPSNQPDVQASLESVLNKAHSGAIYLLHAVSTTNASLLGDAIDGFRDKGFQLDLFQ